MEEQLTQQASKIREVMPYDEARTSTILNGIGNGTMLAASPFLVIDGVTHLLDKKPTKGFHLASVLATVGGAMWGYFSGKSEADHLNEYRIESLREVSDLRHDLVVAEKKINDMQQYLQHGEVGKPADWKQRIAQNDAQATKQIHQR